VVGTERGEGMNDLEKRFEEEIDRVKFDIFEIKGFQAQPKLALIAGMAIGYRIAINDLKEAAHD